MIEAVINNNLENGETIMTEDDLFNYEDLISELAIIRSDELISNSDVGHAKILIRHLFKFAKQKIYIFSSKLNENIYDDSSVLSEIENFVSKRNGNIEILLQEPTKFESTRNIANLLDKYSNNIHVKSVSNNKDKAITQHFVVNDTNGFRFCNDKQKPSAIASFNQKNTATNLSEQFDILFNRARLFKTQSPEMLAES